MEQSTVMHSARWEISPPDDASAARAAQFVETWLDLTQTPVKTAHRIMIAVDEIYSNIIRCSGAGWAAICCRKDESGVTLEFSDDGVPYDPLTAPPPDITSGAQERAIGGLGVFVVRRIMDDVQYRREDGLNVLTIRKE